MFPSAAGYAGFMLQLNENDPGIFGAIRHDRRQYGERTVALYNEWLVGAGRVSDRVRPVALVHADSVERLTAQTKALLDRGIRAIQMPAGKLPGGKSPAHSDLDAYWAMLAEAKCVATLHIGGEGTFFETREWGKAPVFENFRNLGEFTVDPWTLSTFHLAAQNFLATMVVGGVFDRHPTLRFGAIEFGAYWLGGLLDSLDMWYRNAGLFKSPGTYRLPEPPSHYIRRNVRVTPFIFEDVAKMIAAHDLEDVLCFSTDYPHVEGGKNALARFSENLAEMRPSIVEKFFVTNGEWLLPD
jgi:predicted TIM-barrel fold metal-dependent hydrolase